METDRHLAFHAYVAVTEDQVSVKIYEGFPFVLSDALWAALLSAFALLLIVTGQWIGVAWLIVAETILLRICSLPGHAAYAEWEARS